MDWNDLLPQSQFLEGLAEGFEVRIRHVPFGELAFPNLKRFADADVCGHKTFDFESLIRSTGLSCIPLVWIPAFPNHTDPTGCKKTFSLAQCLHSQVRRFISPISITSQCRTLHSRVLHSEIVRVRPECNFPSLLAFPLCARLNPSIACIPRSRFVPQRSWSCRLQHPIRFI